MLHRSLIVILARVVRFSHHIAIMIHGGKAGVL